MKIRNNFLLALTCLFVFASCDVMSPSVSIFDGSGTSYSSSDNIKKADYYGTVDYYADSKGIHISIPLEEHNINKITLYEIQGITDIHMATVKTVSPLYNYALDGSPCGEIMYEVKGETKTEKRSYYRTNYLEGTITLDLSFVEPGKNYNFLLALDEPELETGGGGTYYSSNTSNYEKTPKVRYFKRFSLRAANEVFYSDFIEAEYNSETDKYTVKPVDVKTLGLPFAIKDYSDVSMTASALYKDSLDSKRTPIPVPLAINPVLTTESSLSIIAENIADADYGADYVLASISGSLQFTDHLDYQINDSSTTDEKIAYYTQLYSQKTYSYNCPYIRSSGVTKTVNFSDRRMNLTVTPESDDNLVSFVMLTDASAISIYRQSAEEKQPFLAGAMSGSFKRGETYTFVDYYAEPGVVYTYYVTWDGGRKSKLVSVTTTSSMKYKPNAPVMTYKYDSEEAKGVFTIVTNPFTGKLPEDYHGKIVFEYSQKYKDHNMSWSSDIFDMTITDADVSYTIFKNDIYYKLINYDDVRLTVKEPSSKSYFVTITAQKEGISYQHYYLLKEKGSMPVVDMNDDCNNESSENENQKEKEFEMSDIKLNTGEEFYTLKPSVKDDYAELKSITQNEDGSVSIEIYLPAWTNYAHIRREYVMKYTEELYNTHEWSSWSPGEDGKGS